MLTWIFEGVDMPTDKGIVSPEDPCCLFYESVRALTCIGVVEDVDEGIVGQNDPDLYDRIVEDLNMVSSDEIKSVTSILDATCKLKRA